jgi:hypothetical protein
MYRRLGGTNGTLRAVGYIFFAEGKENFQLGTGFFVHHKKISSS